MSALCEAVMVEAFRPNEIPLASPNVRALSRFDVVPPLIRILESVTAFDCIAVVSPLWDAVIMELLDMPNVIPFELLNITVPVVLAVCVPAARMLTPSPAPPAPADSDNVNPALFDAVVPDRFVRLSVGLPWLWLDCAAVVKALCEAVTAPALVPNEIPLALEKAPIISLPVNEIVRACVAFQLLGLFSYAVLSGVVIERACETVAGISYASTSQP